MPNEKSSLEVERMTSFCLFLVAVNPFYCTTAGFIIYNAYLGAYVCSHNVFSPAYKASFQSLHHLFSLAKTVAEG